MALDIIATLRTALEDASRELQTYQALYKQHGDCPNMNINGVGVDWPTFERHLIDKVKGAQDAYTAQLKLELAADQYANGPVVIVTQGR